MIFKTLKSEEGCERVVRKFLLFPRKFDDESWRWLSFENIVEKVCRIDCGGHDDWGSFKYKWMEVGFEDTYKKEG